MKVLALLGLLVVSFASQAIETPHIQFAQEYIRELGVMEGLRDEAAADLKENGGNALQPFIIGIHSFTRTINALQTNISMLKDMQLSPPHESDVKILISIYETKI